VARRHGLTPQQLLGWGREARRRAKRQARDDKGDTNGANFAPVIVESVLPKRTQRLRPIAAGPRWFKPTWGQARSTGFRSKPRRGAQETSTREVAF